MNWKTKELLKIIGIVISVIGLMAILGYVVLWAIITVFSIFNTNINQYHAIAVLIVGGLIIIWLRGKPILRVN